MHSMAPTNFPQRNDFWQSSYSGQARYGIPRSAPHPESVAELYAEREHLLNCLQHEDRTAADLLDKILASEEVLLQSSVYYQRKAAKKKLGWLRYNMMETNHQERAILARIGHLQYEMQSRERRAWVKNARWEFQHQSSQGIQNMQHYESQYRAFSTPHTHWVPLPGYGFQQYHPPIAEGASGLPAETHTQVDSAITSEDLAKATENVDGETAPEIPRSSTMEDAELDILATDSSLASVTPARCNSL
jgi:hypothetical protein